MISFTKTVGLINITAKRFARRKVVLQSWPNDWVPFHWSRPEKVPGYRTSIDLVPFELPKIEDIQPEFSCSEELKKLSPSDPVRKIFSCDHAPPGKMTQIAITKQLTPLGLIHEVDHHNSREAKIIHLTVKMRKLMDVIDSREMTRARTRMTANSIKYRRLRYLMQLKDLHRDRYERILQLLQIEPEKNLINVEPEKPYRKVQMRRMAAEYSHDIKEKKVADFVDSLAEEKARFVEYKKKTEDWFKEQEKIFGVTV